jgi:hypothetical protein
MTIGFSCSAVCTVAVPDAVRTTSEDRQHVVGAAVEDGDGHAAVGARVRERREQRVVEARRARHQRLDAGHALGEQRQRRDQVGEDLVHLVVPAARQHGEHRSLRVEAGLAQHRDAIRRRRDQVDQRMPDELDRHTGALVDLRLEREDRQHQRREAAHRGQPSLAPRPQLRRDVVDHRHAGGVQRRGEAEVEVGKVDRDEDVGRIAPRLGQQAAIEAPRARQLLHDLGEAGHAVVAIVLDERGAGGREARPAEAHDLDVRLEAAQLLGERGRVEVAAASPQEMKTRVIAPAATFPAQPPRPSRRASG